MLAAVRSAAVLGIDAYDVTVEVDAALGLPTWTIVGLAAHAVRESRERVTAAVLNAGFTLPPRRVTVNLAPADTPKNGTAFDLPIALALLMATGQLTHGRRRRASPSSASWGSTGPSARFAVRSRSPDTSRARVPVRWCCPSKMW